jgi:hypothetical protein
MTRHLRFSRPVSTAFDIGPAQKQKEVQSDADGRLSLSTAPTGTIESMALSVDHSEDIAELNAAFASQRAAIAEHAALIAQCSQSVRVLSE